MNIDKSELAQSLNGVLKDILKLRTGAPEFDVKVAFGATDPGAIDCEVTIPAHWFPMQLGLDTHDTRASMDAYVASCVNEALRDRRMPRIDLVVVREEPVGPIRLTVSLPPDFHIDE